MNFTGVDAAAGAFAGVLSALAAAGTLYVQWRSARSLAPAVAHKTSPADLRTQEAAGDPPDTSVETFVAGHAAVDVDRTGSMHPQPERWLTPKRMAFPPLSGIAAGLIVLLLGAWLSGKGSPAVTIVSPPNGAAVSQQHGFQASGKSHDLGNDTLWLTDYDGSGYTVDSEATIAADGSWTASDSDLGNRGQRFPFALAARVIMADTQCATKLQAAMNSNQDYLTSLPGGCTVAAAATVDVTSR